MNKNDVVIIELDRPRQLWLGHKALKTMSALLGKSLEEMNTGNFSMDEVEKVMYCLMLRDAREHGETLELSQMEDLLDLVPFGAVAAKMEAAFEAAFPDAVQAPEGGTGKNAQRIAAHGGAGKKA